MSQSKKYVIQVEIVCEFINSEIERGVPEYVAEKYADMAQKYASIGAVESRVLTVKELEED